jgi:NAD(P)-dependent dehydrogenase (short-subunit alcohol dehydrogenase family)
MGIGAASARLLAGEGWQLVLLDIAIGPLRSLAAEIGAQAAIEVDATDPDAIAAAVDRGICALGGLDAVWSNVRCRRPARCCRPASPTWTGTTRPTCGRTSWSHGGHCRRRATRAAGRS